MNALRTNPNDFEDRRCYMVVWQKDLDAAGYTALGKARQELDLTENDLGCYQDWDELPDNADLVDFRLGPRGGVDFCGYWWTPREPVTVPTDSGYIKLCFKSKQFGNLRYGTKKDWREPLMRLRDSAYWKEDAGIKEDACIIDLAAFAHEFLNV